VKFQSEKDGRELQIFSLLNVLINVKYERALKKYFSLPLVGAAYKLISKSESFPI